MLSSIVKLDCDARKFITVMWPCQTASVEAPDWPGRSYFERTSCDIFSDATPREKGRDEVTSRDLASEGYFISGA